MLDTGNSGEKLGAKGNGGLVPLLLLAAVLDASLGAIFALLAEIRSQFGFDAFDIGLIGGSGFVAAFVAQVGLARFADRGHARAMLAFGLGCAALGMVVLVFADSLMTFVVGRLLIGLGDGAFLPAARRIVIVRAGANAGEAIGRLTAVQMTGFLAGPMFGSIVNEVFGLRAVFWATLLLIGISAPLVARIKIPITKIRASSRRTLRSLLSQRGMFAMLFAGGGYYGSIGLYEAIWAIYLHDRGASQLIIGLNLTLFAIPMIFLAPWAGRMASRHGGMRVSFLAMASTLPCVAIYGVVESVFVLTLVMLLQAFGDAVVSPASQLAVAEVSGEDIAAGQGLFGACGLAVAAFTAFAGGAAYDAYGPAILFAGGASLMGVSLIVAYGLGREHIRTGALAPGSALAADPSAD
ncbi:MAG: MFS transporter [Myxococcales bacterium]|nr:MFS transporter [Myxococcales bacterium]HIK84206.1 MFS transporter [Myxococcales bacterium]